MTTESYFPALKAASIQNIKQQTFRCFFISCFLIITVLPLIGCNNFTQALPPQGQISFPVSVAVHPSGNYLYVVSSNFDTRYRQDLGGMVTVLDAHSGAHLNKHAAYIPSFAGMMKINATGTKAYIPTRQNNAVTVLDIAPNGAGLYCNVKEKFSSDSSPCQLVEFKEQKNSEDDIQKPITLGKSPYQIDVKTRLKKITLSNFENTPVHFNTDNSKTIILKGTTASKLSKINAISGLLAKVEDQKLIVTPDPAFDGFPVFPHFFPQNNQKLEVEADDTIYVSSMQSSKLSIIQLPNQDVTKASIIQISSGEETGAVAFRPQPQNSTYEKNGETSFIAVQRKGSGLLTFSDQLNKNQSAIEFVYNSGILPLSHVSTYIIGRDIVFDPHGKRAYVITQNPSLLSIINVKTSSNEEGITTTNYVLEKQIPLKNRPISISYAKGTEVLGNSQDQLYIACTGSKLVMVVDAVNGTLIDEILLGDAPAQFVVNEGLCKNDINQCVGYAPLFDDTANSDDNCSTADAGPCGSIAVVDLNPFSPTYHQVIRKFE